MTKATRTPDAGLSATLLWAGAVVTDATAGLLDSPQDTTHKTHNDAISKRRETMMNLLINFQRLIQMVTRAP
jgi:hypothetical protein